MDSGHKATQVPIGTLLAATWNEPLNQQLFNLVGQELFAYKIDTLLGPGINIHRHPLNGRNFEYFSEDPLISGIMAAAQTRGLAEAGVSGTIKHFAANDQETARHDVDSVMSERALREIHIKPFEMAVKIGKTTTIMTAYNPVNGHWAASNYDLNTTILRGEWGYTGIVMSDWWAKMNHNVSAGEESLKYTNYMVRSQNDLYMVVENDKAAENPLEDNSSASLETGELTIGELQRSAMNICRFIMAAPVMERPLEAYDPIKYHKPCDSFNESSQNSIDEIILNTSTNKTTVVEVRQAGTYKFMVEATNPRDAAAQSSCSLYLNGNFAFSLALNGTKGKLKTVEGVPVLLNPGYYELTFDFIKPGIELKVAKLKKID